MRKPSTQGALLTISYHRRDLTLPTCRDRGRQAARIEIQLSAIGMHLDRTSPRRTSQLDPSSPDVHLTILRRRVPHLFNSHTSPRSPKRSLMVEQSPSQSWRRTSNDVHRMLEILCKSLRKDAARRTFTPRSGQAAPHPLRVLFFELCALSHSLLHANPASTVWLKQWSDLLETVAQFYSEVLGGDPRALAESNSHQNNCVRFSQDIQEWIEKVIPHHVNLFRAVYRRPEYVKRREVLRRLLVNLEDFSSLFPDVDNTRRDQLQALMTQIVTGLLGPVDDDEVTLVQDLDPVDFKQLVTGVSGRSFDLFFRNFDWSCFDTDLGQSIFFALSTISIGFDSL